MARPLLLRTHFILSLFLTSCIVTAAETVVEYRPSKILEVTAEHPETNATLQGVRYPNPGRPPVILYHGFTNNTRTMRDIGYALHQQGFDVWLFNFRGHGNGSHRSTVKKMHGAAYAYEGLAAEDVFTGVEHVFAQTGRKAHVMGFSMGGMATLNYAEGWRYLRKTADDGKGTFELVRDVERARWIGAHRVESITMLGTPKHLRNLGLLFKAISKVTKGLTPLSGALPRISPDRAPTEPNRIGTLEKLRKKTRKATIPALKKVVPLDVINSENVGDGEFYGFLEKGMSNPHPQTVESFRRAAERGYMMDTSGRINFSEIHPVYVKNVFFGAGELDGLAPASDVIDVASELASKVEEGVRVHPPLVVLRASHGDLITGRFSQEYLAPHLGAFLRNEPTPALSGPGACDPSLAWVVRLLKYQARFRPQ